MKPKMKYSTSKISPAKLNNKANKALTKPCKLRKSKQKAEEICHVYCMKLRSGLTIEKKACYFRKETTKRCLRKAESCAFLSTYNDQSVSFVLEDGEYVINVEDLRKDETKDKVYLRYYESQYTSSESGDGVDGKMLMVNLSPTKDKDIWLHANNEEHSVELQKCKTPLPDQAFFVLHKESSDFVSFECKSNRGTYIGVKDNQLALIEGKNPTSENIMFKLNLM